MTWKAVNRVDYLVKIINRTGGNKSLGVRYAETERIYAEFSDGKTRAKERLNALKQTVSEFAGMCRQLMLNRVPNIVTATLRKLDNYGLLGKNILVIGTNSLYGYESAAGVQFDSGLTATTYVDFLWDARATLKLGLLDDEVAADGVLAILRKLDKSFEPVMHQPYRAVNRDGFYVDLVKQALHPPWRNNEPDRLANGVLTPSWLQNIKWLLSSEQFSSIIIGQEGQPAPMVAPDPRAFAVYKHWLSIQPDREPKKKRRDQMQATEVVDLLRVKFPHLALDANAERMFPKSVRRMTRDTGFSL